MTDKRVDNVEGKVADAMVESKTAPPPITNYEAIQKLTHNFAVFVETCGLNIPELSLPLSQLKGDDAAAKIAFIKTQIAPRIDTLHSHIVAGLQQHKIVLPEDKLEKCIRFMRAMVEVANQ